MSYTERECARMYVTYIVSETVVYARRLASGVRMELMIFHNRAVPIQVHVGDNKYEMTVAPSPRMSTATAFVLPRPSSSRTVSLSASSSIVNGDAVVFSSTSFGPLSPHPVKLIDLAYGRSGDKGDMCNIGVIARRSKYYDYLKAVLTADVSEM